MLIQTRNQNARSLEPNIGHATKIGGKRELTKLSFFQSSCDMIYYSLDPQFATLLFSVYSRNERSGFSIIPDTFSFSTSVSSTGSVLSYAQTVGLQLIALGEQYASFFSQVRAGSVIFLVGVGSLVCWKIWDYINSSEGIDPRHGGGPRPSPSSKTPTGKGVSKSSARSPKAFLASFLEEEFVHDFEEFEDEDPALIQGKYFGPESPVEHPQSKFLRENVPEAGIPERIPSSELAFATERNTPERLYKDDQSPLLSEYSGRTDSGKVDIAGDTTAYLADDDAGSGTSDYEESLPLDPATCSTSSRETRRLKRRHHNQRLERRQEVMDGGHLPGSKSEPTCIVLSNSTSKFLNSLGNENSSSETSPRDKKGISANTSARPSRLSSYYQNSCGRELNKCNKENLKHGNSSRSSSTSNKPYFYANCNSDDEWGIEERDENEVENARETVIRKRSLSRDLSLSDLVGRLRKRSSFRSLSRDNSVSSRMSDFLRRDDSICSNLSDFAFSECSEISLELSIKDESIADQTITSLADIEDELNTLKSSVIEMDEEFLRFASKPNPYLLRTTYTDYSLDSSESRPESSLDNDRKIRSRSNSIVNESDTCQNMSHSSLTGSLSKNSLTNGNERDVGDGRRKESLASSHQEEIKSVQKECTPKKIRRSRRRSSTEVPAKISSQDDALPSLEWDNGCFKEYEDDIKRKEAECQYDVGEHQLDRHKFLPDHSSLELDLEKELQTSEEQHPTFSGRDILASTLSPCISPSSSVVPSCTEDSLFKSMNARENQKPLPQKRQPPSSLPLRPSTEMPCNNMTASIDSAIQSAPGSRSGSSSPISHMTQSMMSSGICGSWTESLVESSENLKLKKFWGVAESGYVEGDYDPQSSGNLLTPINEVREGKDQRVDVEDNIDIYPNLDHESIRTDHNEINGNNTINNNNNNNSNSSDNSSILILNNSNNNGADNNSMGHSFSSDSRDLSTKPVLNNASSYAAVGDVQDLLLYSQSEWQGDTDKAKTIKAGYGAIPHELNLHNLRRIRGDNYCGIRAVLFQILVSGIPVPNSYQVYNRLLSEVNRGALWLTEYTFGKRLTYPKSEVVQGFRDCLETLDKFVLDLAECNNTEETVVTCLNTDPLLDIRLCEAAKLHMLASALDLYKLETEGVHVPLFGMIMFARQNCLNPRDFMMNHLNSVGDSAGLEQIEMFLLGHALKVTLQVVRPSSFGSEDFICFYPDENIGIWPEVTLVAEDDRHYNVLVK